MVRMQFSTKTLLMAAMMAGAAAPALALNTLFDTFTPVVTSAPALPAGDPGEAMPFILPTGFSQMTIADRSTQNGLFPGSNSGNWDMVTSNENGPDAGRYLFTPYETNTGGVMRVDTWDTNYNTRTLTIVAPGTQSFVAGDASRWTPFGTYLTAEESWGTGSTRGRLFEVTNPLAAGANSGNFVARNVIPRVSHEGLAFDTANNMYFIDELNGGSIYKYVPTNPNAANGNDYFSSGQTFALKVGAGGQFEGNNGPAITGTGAWVAITDASGGPLAGISVLATAVGLPANTIDGRATADVAAVLGTGYNRPEDLEMKTLTDGTQIMFFATTDSDNDATTSNGRGRVYSLNLTTNEVKLYADNFSINSATGNAVGQPWSNPDNLAIDSEGNIYAIEDQNGGVANIWFTKDADNDGVAEYVSAWATLLTNGAEPTGLYFDPFNPNVAYVNVQHPSSGNDRMIMITVPEPASMMLLSLSGLALLGRRRLA